MEMEPVFSDSGLKIPQDDRNNARADKNRKCFFITNSVKKSFKPFYYTPPPTNVQDKYYKYNKNLQKKAVPKDSSFLLPGNAYFLMLQSPHKLICLLGDCCSVTAYCKSIICQRKTVYCSCKVKSCHSGRLFKYSCSFRTAIHCNIYCICYRS